MLDVEELLNRLARTPEKPYCRILRRSIDARKGVRFQLRVECSATPFQPRSLEPQVEPVDPSALECSSLGRVQRGCLRPCRCSKEAQFRCSWTVEKAFLNAMSAPRNFESGAENPATEP